MRLGAFHIRQFQNRDTSTLQDCQKMNDRFYEEVFLCPIKELTEAIITLITAK